MSKGLKFQCWNCDGTRIEEVMIDVTQYTEIDIILKGGCMDYRNHHCEDGDVKHYQCINCGEILGDGTIDNEIKLAKWLQQKCKQD